MKNIKKYAITVIFLAVLIAPNFTSADTISDLQAQISALLQQIQSLQAQLSAIQEPAPIVPTPTPTPVITECPIFTYSLYMGLRDAQTGGQVTQLQQFLAQDPSIYPEGLVTGYFGPLTEMAVKRWQANQGVVSSGSPDTTGYGVVGPITRAKITTVTDCPEPVPPIPVPPFPFNQPPVIHSLSGPTYLSVNQVANWTIKASDPENGPLTYSVRWGDEVAVADEGVAKSLMYIQTTSFSHSYSSPGIYYPTFTVADNQGASAKSSISVNVGTIVVQTGSMKIEVKELLCTNDVCGYETLTNVKVSVYNSSGSYIGTKDTSGGTAVFEKLPVGIYTAVASADGYENAKAEFKILANIDGYLTIYLERKTTVNHPPEIIGFPGIPEIINPGQTVNFSWTAKDSDNDNLAWSVSWGDGAAMVQDCQSPNPKNGQGWEFTATHSWSTAGTYTVTTTVSDCNGGSDTHSFTIDITARLVCSTACDFDGDNVFTNTDSQELSTCIFTSGINDCLNTDINNDNKVDAGDISACTLCSADFLSQPNCSGCDFNKDGSISQDEITQLTNCPFVSGINQCYNRDANSDGVLDAGDISYCALYCAPTSSITVISPNGGEEWVIGNTYNIQWESTGVSKVSLWVCGTAPDVTSGTSCGRLSGIPTTGINTDSGSYSWYINPINAYYPDDDLRIRVASEDDYPVSTLYDESDAAFSIVAATLSANEAKLDYNNDGVLNEDDVTYHLSIVVGSKACSTDKVCDINNDGAIDISDTILVNRIILGLDPVPDFSESSASALNQMANSLQAI